MAQVRYKPLWNLIQNKPIFKPATNIGFFGFKAVRLNTPTSIKNIPRKNLTWDQASMRYPRLSPFGDTDRDGKINLFDCRPFNRNKHGDFLMPPDELETGEIMDPFYDEYMHEAEQNKKKIEAAQQAQQIRQQQQQFTPVMKQVRKIIPNAQKWARPGVYNEGDYLETENAIDEYVGSGSGSAVPVRGFNPGAGGNKYG